LPFYCCYLLYQKNDAVFKEQIQPMEIDAKYVRMYGGRHQEHPTIYTLHAGPLLSTIAEPKTHTYFINKEKNGNYGTMMLKLITNIFVTALFKSSNAFAPNAALLPIRYRRTCLSVAPHLSKNVKLNSKVCRSSTSLQSNQSPEDWDNENQGGLSNLSNMFNGFDKPDFSQSDNWDNGNEFAMEKPRPDPSILLASQEPINQQIGFVAIFVSVLFATVLMVNILTGFEHILPKGWFDTMRDFTWPLGLGLIFSAAGASHFTLKESFMSIVPPPGTWGGLWNIPAPGAQDLGLTYEEYHTYWTGIAELAGGLLLIGAGTGIFWFVPVKVPAFLLFLLLLCVTPANIYQFTHDAIMEGTPPIPYPEGHVFRGFLQALLLAMFWMLSFP